MSRNEKTVKIKEGLIKLHDKFSGYLIDYYPFKENKRKNGAVDFCIYIPQRKRIAYYSKNSSVVEPFKKYLEKNNYEIKDIVTCESITLK